MSATTDQTPSEQVSAQSMNSRFGLPGSGRVWFELVILGGGQFATIAGMIVGTRVLTELLLPAAYGDLALALTFSSLLSLVGAGPIGNAVGRFYIVAFENGSLRTFCRAVAVLYSQYHLGASGLALTGLLLYSVARGSREWIGLGTAVVSLSVITGAGSLLDSMQNAARHRSVVALHQASGQWLRVLGSVLCIRQFGPSALSAIWGYTAASVLVFVSQACFFRFRILSGIPEETQPRTGETASEMRHYANSFVVLASIAWLQQASDRWLLALFDSRKDVGLYQTLNQVGYSPLAQFSGLLSMVVAPILFSQAGDGKNSGRVLSTRQKAYQLSGLMLAVTAVLTTFLSILHKPIFALLVAAEYRSMSSYLPLTALSGGLFATGQMLSNIPLVQMNSKALIVPKIGTALLAVILNIAGAWAFGVRGVIWASVASSSVYALWMLATASSIAPVQDRVGL
jgi:O-antigen/teichoic acid export membrane protein